MTEQRFNLTEEYKDNLLLPISDSVDGRYDGIMLTEVVCILNKLHNDAVLRKKIIKKLVHK